MPNDRHTTNSIVPNVAIEVSPIDNIPNVIIATIAAIASISAVIKNANVFILFVFKWWILKCNPHALH